MTHATRVLLLISGLALGLGACTSRAQVEHRTATPAPNEPAPNEPGPNEPGPTPRSRVPVEVTVASATLGDDCPAPETAAADSIAQQPVAADAPAAGAPAMRSSTPNGRFAPGFCQRTGLQLAITAPDHHPGGALEVLEVRLLTMDSAPVGTLEVRGQTLFENGAYIAWDGNVQPGQQNVSLHTSGPDWSSIGGGYGQSFKVEVDVRVDGETRTLELAPVSREAMVVT